MPDAGAGQQLSDDVSSGGARGSGLGIVSADRVLVHQRIFQPGRSRGKKKAFHRQPNRRFSGFLIAIFLIIQHFGKPLVILAQVFDQVKAASRAWKPPGLGFFDGRLGLFADGRKAVRQNRRKFRSTCGFRIANGRPPTPGFSP